MKDPETMTTEQRVKWLHKTEKSIATYVSQGGQMKYERGLTLLDRYNTLRSAIVEHDGYEFWCELCEKAGADATHDGYDLFA